MKIVSAYNVHVDTLKYYLWPVIFIIIKAAVLSWIKVIQNNIVTILCLKGEFDELSNRHVECRPYDTP